MKHNKLKNTGILFEILCKHIMHETLNPTLPQRAMKIVKHYFKHNSLLLSELKLYQQLSQKSIKVNENELLNLVLSEHKGLDFKKLNEEKYNLIKVIKRFYNLNEFYQSRVSNYKLLASIYNLFENRVGKNPTLYLKNKQFILESLKGEPLNQVDELETKVLQEDKDIRKLSFKIIVEKFNEKYQGLNPRQKKLLSKYINEDTMSLDFKNYVLKECNWISKQLDQKVKSLQDPIQQIKVKEVSKLLEHIIISDKMKEEHLSSMLKYYELIEEI